MRHQGQRALSAAHHAEPVQRLDPDLFTGITADLLRQGTGVLFTAFGRSMTPTIRHGDTLHVAPAESGVRVGSIILYTSERGRTVAHRVLGCIKHRGRETLLVRGDASSRTCERVPRSLVLGVVTQLQRGLLVRPLRRRHHRWAAVVKAHLRTGRAAVSRGLRRLRARTRAASPRRLHRA